MSTMSVIAAICVSITLSAAIVVVVVCCRHGTTSGRRPRRRRAGGAWPLRLGGGYAATAEAVACEMQEFDPTASFDQCSVSTTVDDDVRRPLNEGDRPGSSSRTRSTLPPSCRSVFLTIVRCTNVLRNVILPCHVFF